MSANQPSDLPYTDTKPQGSPDFYFAINATFRFLIAKLGRDGWIRYLEDLGRGYFAPVNRQWAAGGLPAVARYWRAFFAAEPGARVDVVEFPDRVELRVAECPAIKHLKASGRDIVPEYCHHCYHLGAARAQSASLTMSLAGGNGQCCHTYALSSAALAQQDLGAIREAHA